MTKLGIRICKTNIDAQKIDCSRLEIYEIVIILFQIDKRNEKSSFIEETFSFTDILMNVAFEPLFLILSNVKINFND